MSKKRKLAKKYATYDGQLEAYHETGMECQGLTLYKDGFEKANPDYIEGSKKWPHNIPFFRSYEGQEYIAKGDILTVMKEDGITKERTIRVVPDFQAAVEDNHRLSIYMKGVTREEIFEWFAEGTFVDKLGNTCYKKPRRATLKKLLK